MAPGHVAWAKPANRKAKPRRTLLRPAEPTHPISDPRLQQEVESRGTEESGKGRRKKRTKARPIGLRPRHEQGELEGGVGWLGNGPRVR